MRRESCPTGDGGFATRWSWVSSEPVDFAGLLKMNFALLSGRALQIRVLELEDR